MVVVVVVLFPRVARTCGGGLWIFERSEKESERDGARVIKSEIYISEARGCAGLV